MNQLEKTFFEMEGSCITYLKNYNSQLRTVPGLAEDARRLEANYAEVDVAALKQSSADTKAPIAVKRDVMLALGKQMYQLCRRLVRFGTKAGIATLVKEADVAESNFYPGDESDVMRRFKAMLALARTYLGQMDEYQVTEAYLTTLESRLAELEKMPDTLNTVKETRKTATRSLKTLQNEARAILEEIDDAMEGYIDDEELLASWFDTRKIKGRRDTRKKNGDSNGNGTDASSKE